MTLRIYADFNSCIEDERGVWCWCLRYDGRVLDEVAETLGLVEGMAVTLYYEDDCDSFEYDATLGHVSDPHWRGMWMALFDQNSFRRIR